MVVEIQLLGADRREVAYPGYSRQRCDLELAIVAGHIGASNRNRVAFPFNPGEPFQIGGFVITGPGFEPMPGWLAEPFDVPQHAGFVFEVGKMQVTFIKDPDEAPVLAVARLGDALTGILTESPGSKLLTPREMLVEAALEIADHVAEFDPCLNCGRGIADHAEDCEVGRYVSVKGSRR